MTSLYPLQSIAEILGSSSLIADGDWIESKDQDPNGSIRLIQLADIGDGRFINKSSRFLTKETASRLKCTSLQAGDIIIARMPDPIGRACIFPGDSKEAITVVDVCILRVDEKSTDARWLMSAINADFTRKAIEKAAGGTTRTRISRSSLEKLLLPTPPLSEQKKIAVILTAVDDKLDVIARQIEATQTLKQGLMQTLFSRGVGAQEADGHWAPHTEFKDSELGEIPSAWMVTTVGEVCEVKGGKRLPKGETLTEENTGHPYIRVTDMFMGGVDTAGILYVPSHVQATIARYTISKDDIFISVAGTLGLVGIVPEELDGANLTENADKLTDIKINRDYLFYCLCSDAIQDLIAREATSNAQPKLALTRIREFSFPLPPDEEQARIATILVSVDEKLRLLSTKRESYLSLKRGLMQKLLTGEWRVKLDSPTGTA